MMIKLRSENAFDCFALLSPRVNFKCKMWKIEKSGPAHLSVSRLREIDEQRNVWTDKEEGEDFFSFDPFFSFADAFSGLSRVRGKARMEEKTFR